MRMLSPKSIFFAVFLTFAATQPTRVLAQVFSSFSLDQAVVASAPEDQTNYQIVTGTTLPIQQTVTEGTSYGGTITATYNVTDNGSVATLEIAATGSITPNDYGVDEEDAGSPGTMFDFTRPVKYTAIFAESGEGELNIFLEGGGAYISNGFSDTNQTYSGVIYPDVDGITLNESWSLSNSLTPSSQSGADYIDFTFTAIPEPSSIALIGIPAAFAVSRRRRRASRPRRLQRLP